ncbi:MAG: hypothetical protein AAB417_01710 [Patescibacteria group bacterium]
MAKKKGDTGRGSYCSVCGLKRRGRHRSQEDCRKAVEVYHKTRRRRASNSFARYGHTAPQEYRGNFVARAIAQDRERLQRQLEEDRKKWSIW